MPTVLGSVETKKSRGQVRDDDVSDSVPYVPAKKVYKQETLDILAEAKRRYEISKKSGKTRDEYFKSLFDVLEIK